MPKNDLLWKAIFEYTFEDFLTFFFPNSKDIFDFRKEPVFLDKELQQIFPPEDGQYNPTYVDKLVKIPTIEGDEEWILVHIEIQGTPEKLFERRMFRYYSRIFDKYDKQIIAIAIFTDNDQTFHPTKFENSFLGTSLSYQFNTLKVLDQSIEELQQNSNPFACVILAVLAAIEGKKKGYDFTFKFKKELFVEFDKRNLEPEKKRAVLLFLDKYVELGNKELVDIFETEVKEIKTKNNMSIQEVHKLITIEEIKEEEREKTTKEVVKNLLISNKHSVSEISQITGTSDDFVIKVKNEL